ncbi:MAG: cysteine desulfurase [Candidatus Hadarchaeales archaeon]
MNLNIQNIRKDFPILKTGIIYLDSASSSLTPEPVLNKMLEYYHSYRANVGRGIHTLSAKATDEFEAARKTIGKFIHAKPEEIIFTKNTTEGINLVAGGIRWKRGDKIVSTLLEHHSNFIVWQRLEKQGVRLEKVRPNEEGLLQVEDFERAIDENTRLVSLTHVSNVLGTVSPVEEIARLAQERGAELLVDGAQSVPHMEVNVKKLGCTYLAFSGHKMLGPTGIGVLYVKEEAVQKLEPLSIGGGTIADVSSERYELTKPPERFEAGTPPIAEAIGLGEAIRYLTRIGFPSIERHERFLTKLTCQALGDLRGVEVYGPADASKRRGIIPFNVRGVAPDDVARVLARANIMVRSGHHCALPLHKEVLKRPGTVRVSVYIYNTAEEIERLSQIVAEIVKKTEL